MSLREIRIATFGFWAGFKFEWLTSSFPYLRRKYLLIHDQERPDLLVFSVFGPEGTYWYRNMPTAPDRGVPKLFLTAENVKPDMQRCDFAILFCRDIDNPKHRRIPNWVWRLYRTGL